LVNDAGEPVAATTAGVKVGSETHRIPLPFAPNDIIDSGGANDVTCGQPLLWVLSESGQLAAVNMKTLTVPQCGAGGCVIETGARARTGATDGKRIVVGGPRAVSEVSYFRPNRNPLEVPSE
jgi:hypothetical protein